MTIATGTRPYSADMAQRITRVLAHIETCSYSDPSVSRLTRDHTHSCQGQLMVRSARTLTRSLDCFHPRQTHTPAHAC
eukprot:7591273-Pyramimonas_sp.AAC.1